MSTNEGHGRVHGLDDPRRKRGRAVPWPVGDTRLARLREDRDYAQQIVAASVGLDRSGLSRLERGNRLPSFAVACRIMTFYGVTFEQAFGDRVDEAVAA